MKTKYFQRRGVAVNTDERSPAYLVAANVNPMPAFEGEVPAEEWLEISPYGEFPNKKGKQIVRRSHADRMVAAFNSLLGRAARGFRGLPIYVGHPDVDPQRWPDDRRYGRVNQLDARDGGLWGLVAWNDLGRKNRAEGYYVYPSPAWFFPKNRNGVVEPDELLSIGLTNTPNIVEVAPWTNSGAPTSREVLRISRASLIARKAGLILPGNATSVPSAKRAALGARK